MTSKLDQLSNKNESSNGESLRAWITKEIELGVDFAEASNRLLKERKESNAELIKLGERLEEIKL